MLRLLVRLFAIRRFLGAAPAAFATRREVDFLATLLLEEALFAVDLLLEEADFELDLLLEEADFLTPAFLDTLFTALLTAAPALFIADPALRATLFAVRFAPAFLFIAIELSFFRVNDTFLFPTKL